MLFCGQSCIPKAAAAFLASSEFSEQNGGTAMTKLTTTIVAAALAAGAAAPLAAQYYPQPQPQPYPYPQPQQPYPYPQQGYQQGYGYGGGNNVLGQIIDGLIGNRWGVNDRQAVRQCTFAAVNQAENQYRPYFGPNFRRPYQGYNGYVRVSQITDVQRRNGGVRVRGLLDTGLYRTQQYGYPNNYGGDLTFRCDVDYRGYVTNVRINRNNGRGWR